jgi:hypothetical protein
MRHNRGWIEEKDEREDDRWMLDGGAGRGEREGEERGRRTHTCNEDP